MSSSTSSIRGHPGGGPTKPQLLSSLRKSGWSNVPPLPGVYWWYFPPSALYQLRIADLCVVSRLQLRYARDGKVCLYHGMANNLAQRVEWHAAQSLTQSCLKSGFLSTFRLTLLALNGFQYLKGSSQIDTFFDCLAVSWQSTSTRKEAAKLEQTELHGAYHYPLNIQGNNRSELAQYLKHLKSVRSVYRALSSQ